MGVQLVSSGSLKPNQRVRLSLQDESGPLRFNGSIAWASFEIPPKSGPRYRAGIEFMDADGAAVDDFIKRTTVSRTSGRRIVSSRSEPVETIATRTPDTSSSRAM